MKLNVKIMLALFAVLFCSCGTKEELFESYDSCFVPVSSNAASFVLTHETESLLLRDAYEVSLSDKDGNVVSTTFCLSCPVECKEYHWFITPVGYKGLNTDIEDLDKASLSDEQNGKYCWHNRKDIAFYIAKSNKCIFFDEALRSEQSCSYRIHLVVKVGEGDDFFHDHALLVIRALTNEQKEAFNTGN